MGKISDIIQFLHDNNPGALQMAADKFYQPGLSLDEIKKRSESYAVGTPNEVTVLLSFIGSVPYNDKATNYTAGYKFYVKKGTENNLIPNTYIEIPKRAKSGYIFDLNTGSSGTSVTDNVDESANQNNQKPDNKPNALDWFNSAGTVFGNLAGAAANIISAVQGQGSNPANILGGVPGAGGAPLILLPQQQQAPSSDKRTSTIMIVGIALVILVVLIIVMALIFRKK